MSTSDDQWSEPLATGDPEIDEEHRFLLEGIAAIEQAVVEGSGLERVLGLYSTLAAETDTHFFSEELLIQKRHSTGFEKHAADHVRLLGELAGIQHALEAGTMKPDMGLVKVLKASFSAHIQLFDRQLKGLGAQ